MTEAKLNAHEIGRLSDLARVLIPGTEKMPPVDDLDNFAELLVSGVKAIGLTDAELRALLETLPPDISWESMRAFSAARPVSFEPLAQLVTGAYLMAPQVLNGLGFPTERRFPAGPEEFADEYETGILDPVVNRGAHFRDPRLKG
jgi:hypothetical protein